MSEYVGRVFCKTSEDMSEIPDGVVQTCVTSPPYYGLRDYGTASWEGGDEACDHAQGRPGSNADGVVDVRGQRDRDGVGAMGGDCKRCGATRLDEQIGLEPSLDEYIARMVGVFREVRRVLRDDGTLWLNLGDSYAGSWGAQGRGAYTASDDGVSSALSASSIAAHPKRRYTGSIHDAGLKAKDLIGVPWTVAFALRADGWWLRDAIVWAKPSCMPSSVADRCTPSYEMIFMLAKSARYFYDQDAIREPLAPATLERIQQAKWVAGTQAGSVRANGGAKTNGPMRAVVNAKGFARPAQIEDAPENYDERGANKRNVWTIASEPYSEAHFATFPRALPATCIRAGSSEAGCCAKCGASRVRNVEFVGGPPRGDHRKKEGMRDNPQGNPSAGTIYGADLSRLYAEHGMPERRTLGFEPSCDCFVIRCSCAFVVESYYARQGTSTKAMPEMWRKLQAGEMAADVLFSRLQEPFHGDESCDDERIRNYCKRLQSIAYPRPPYRDENGIHNGAPLHHGEVLGEAVTFERRRASFEQRQDGQPNRKLGIVGEEHSRPTSEASAPRNSNVSALRWEDSRLGSCPQCESRLGVEPFATVPSLILDCFMGSGTTAEVAESLGRRWVGYELNPAYHALIAQRTQQRGLFSA